MKEMMLMSDEKVIIRDLSDEEIENFYKLGIKRKMGLISERATIRGLLKEFGIKYDDLPQWLQDKPVGRCNHATRTDKQIYITRKNSKFKDKKIINLNPNRHVPFYTVQTQVKPNFIHEMAYGIHGNIIYRA